MKLRDHIVRIAPVLTLLAPLAAHAQAASQVAGLFNIFVGLMLVAAILVYAVGAIMWYTRLGTWPSYRTEGTKVLEWSVVILFVLVVILMVVQFFRDHPTAAAYVVAALFIVLLIFVIFSIMKNSEKKEEKEH
ncbi:hypothetical protein HY418_00100 [Candidatus Kaiserbacteria bacterium]|nr:hypothetical protein [Candidatus Kaiserbacteria bacterium]